jgi:TRAP-type C4-dicarboxylate transport system permease small subunit
MTDIETKKMASLFIVGLVFAGTALGFAGVGAVQLLDGDSTVLTQEEDDPAIQICGGEDGEAELKSLVKNLFNFIIYAGTIGAFVASVWNYMASNFGNDMDGVMGGSWTDPLQKAVFMYVIIYGGGIAMDLIFGIDVTCILPGFPG